jgi:GAF domain-containing protein
VTASSPTDIKPVLVAVAENAARLCEANDVQIYQVDGDLLRQVTHFGPLPALEDGEALPLTPGLITGRAVLERRTIHIEDMEKLSKSDYLKREASNVLTRTAIATPLVKEGKAIGAIVVRRNEVRPITEKQISLLSTFANQAAIAVENVRLFNETQRLLKETEDRAAELSIINSVQKGLASKLDMQAIYDLVGDKVRDIFTTEVVYVAIRNTSDPNLIEFPYYLDRGNRLNVTPVKLGDGITSRVVTANRPLIANSVRNNTVAYMTVRRSRSPILGCHTLETLLRCCQCAKLQANVFGELEVRLLSTLASSMGVALENARLFDETQRLLKETEERNAELAIITSVQQGLVSKLEIQAIYDLVGDKIRDVLDAQGVVISYYERETN